MELCSILEACGRARVHSLRLGNLEVIFGADQSRLDREPPTPIILDGPMSATKSPTGDPRTQEEILSEAMILDPALYEKIAMNGEIENGEG